MKRSAGFFASTRVVLNFLTAICEINRKSDEIGSSACKGSSLTVNLSRILTFYLAKVAATLSGKHGPSLTSPDRLYQTIATPTSSPPPLSGSLLGSGSLGHRAKRKRMSTSLSHTSELDLGEGSSSQPMVVNDSTPTTPVIRSFSQLEHMLPSQLHSNSKTT